MNANFKLLRNLVMILPIHAIQRESGLIVTAVEKNYPSKGVVLVTGPGSIKKDDTVNEVPVVTGDYVVYSKSNLKEVKYQGDILHVVEDSEIICKLVDE